MADATRGRATAAMAVALAVIMLPACGGGTPGTQTPPAAADGVRPEQIVPAPRGVLAAAMPQANGVMWALAGSGGSRGLFEFELPGGQVVGSVPVSGAAQAVAQSQTGLIGMTLATRTSGALELLDGGTAKLIRAVPLAGPARDVVIGSDETTFYVLTGTAAASSVAVVNSRQGRVLSMVPVPRDSVSVVADVQQTTLFVLERDGRISEVSIADGKVMTSFVVGSSGRSLARSPDGKTLYVLKGTDATSNVAVVDIAAESVRRALPAPQHCLEVLTSAGGGQLYEVVGTAGYGNIQVFAA